MTESKCEEGILLEKAHDFVKKSSRQMQTTSEAKALCGDPKKTLPTSQRTEKFSTKKDSVSCLKHERNDLIGNILGH